MSPSTGITPSPHSHPAPSPPSITRIRRSPVEQRRWTLHGLNNGRLFRATRRGVAALPRVVSYAIGYCGTWLAWRLMPGTRAALADNLRALYPQESEGQLQRRGLATLRAYALDVIDFLRALDAAEGEVGRLFSYREEDAQRMNNLLAQGRGVILVTGHYGNWEVGSVLLRRVLNLPLTIVAMAEQDEEVNRIRREIRDALAAETLEVRRSLDTALQIRRRLAGNQIVAMLVDRHLGQDRVQVSLLGRRAFFLRSPALMAYLTGAPLVPCFIERTGPARFQVHLDAPIAIARDVPRDEAIRRAGQAFAERLEERIRTAPHFWYHFYPYWKAQEDEYATLRLP